MLPEAVVTGYYDNSFWWMAEFADYYPTSPIFGSGPGGEYSAQPTAHTNCVVNNLDAADKEGIYGDSPPSQPNNMSLPIPIRQANPIDIVNGSPVGASYGGVNTYTAFMTFPNLADGTWAAITSAKTYATKGATITELINIWAPA